MWPQEPEPGKGIELSAQEAAEAAAIEQLVADKARGTHKHEDDIHADLPGDVKLDEVLPPSKELTLEAANLMALEAESGTYEADIAKLEELIAQAQGQFELYDKAGNAEAAAETYTAMQELSRALEVLKGRQGYKAHDPERRVA